MHVPAEFSSNAVFWGLTFTPKLSAVRVQCMWCPCDQVDRSVENLLDCFANIKLRQQLLCACIGVTAV